MICPDGPARRWSKRDAGLVFPKLHAVSCGIKHTKADTLAMLIGRENYASV